MVHNTDVSIDIYTDRPTKGMTNLHQGDLLGSELAVADTNRELECEKQSYLKNTEETQLSYDAGGLSSQELEDAIRREVLRNRLVGQVNATDADISMDQLRSEGLRRWNTDMDIEYQYETFNGLPVYYERK